MRALKLGLGGGATLALSVACLAYADGASENVAHVDGDVRPAKLDKNRFRRVSSFTGVRTEANIDGTQANPASELISFGKNIRIRPNVPPVCTAVLANGSTPQLARSLCPAKSFLGAGEATMQFPGQPPIDDIVVSVFNGPGPNQLRLHTYSPTLGTASPTVNGEIVKSTAGARYGQALSVPHAPETGSGMITEFNSTITKASGYVTARCRAKRLLILRRVTYNDGSTETATESQRCRRR